MTEDQKLADLREVEKQMLISLEQVREKIKELEYKNKSKLELKRINRLIEKATKSPDTCFLFHLQPYQHNHEALKLIDKHLECVEDDVSVIYIMAITTSRNLRHEVWEIVDGPDLTTFATYDTSFYKPVYTGDETFSSDEVDTQQYGGDLGAYYAVGTMEVPAVLLKLRGAKGSEGE